MNRDFVLSRLDLMEKALKVAREHAQILRWSVEADDVDGITRGRQGLHSALGLVHQMGGEVDAEMPDWRPVPEHTEQADGCGRLIVANDVNASCTVRIWPAGNPLTTPNPDNHLGAVSE